MGKCDRCQRSDEMITSSVFNTQDVCTVCYYAESEHPGFHLAKDKQNDEILSGNYSFEGTGLPKDIIDYYNDRTVVKLNI